MTDKMQTKQLDRAYQETSKLVDFLVKRDWDTSPKLLEILERANREICQIVDQAIDDVIANMEGSYLEEAQGWANNIITDLNGTPIKINKAEQKKAQTEANKIRAVALRLRGIK